MLKQTSRQEQCPGYELEPSNSTAVTNGDMCQIGLSGLLPFNKIKTDQDGLEELRSNLAQDTGYPDWGFRCTPQFL
jgi:hypothetical protein